MKRLSLAAFVLVAVGIIGTVSATPVFAKDLGYAGLARVSDSEKNSQTVKARTLDEVRNINRLYFNEWGRDARVDELQFHVDHVASHAVLTAWLEDNPQAPCTLYNAACRYNVGTEQIDRLAGHTVSTDAHEFFFIKDGKRWVIPDFPTMNAWGLLFNDRWSTIGPATAYLKSHYPLGGTLNYADGVYHDEIQTYWSGRDGNAVPETLPEAMQDLFVQTMDSNVIYGDWHWLGVQTSSSWVGYSYNNLLDWSYLD